MCSVIVHFLHCICVCDCDGRHESLIMLTHSVMVRCSHLLARCIYARQLLKRCFQIRTDMFGVVSMHNILQSVGSKFTKIKSTNDGNWDWNRLDNG
jgi:hypothetical protein